MTTSRRRWWGMLVAALALAPAGCGSDGDAKGCSGCRVNGSFYDQCPSNPAAFCAVGRPCKIVFNVCS